MPSPPSLFCRLAIEVVSPFTKSRLLPTVTEVNKRRSSSSSRWSCLNCCPPVLVWHESGVVRSGFLDILDDLQYDRLGNVVMSSIEDGDR